MTHWSTVQSFTCNSGEEKTEITQSCVYSCIFNDIMTSYVSGGPRLSYLILDACSCDLTRYLAEVLRTMTSFSSGFQLCLVAVTLC